MKVYILSYPLILNLLGFDLKISSFIKINLAKKNEKPMLSKQPSEQILLIIFFYGAKHILHGNMGKKG